MNITIFLDIVRDGEEREIEVWADVYGPEFDVGIMSAYCEGVSAKDGTELTEDEQDKAEEKIIERYNDDLSGAWEGEE